MDLFWPRGGMGIRWRGFEYFSYTGNCLRVTMLRQFHVCTHNLTVKGQLSRSFVDLDLDLRDCELAQLVSRTHPPPHCTIFPATSST
ncbi:unnamed protein product, partial [Sphenostylis stenocarpa]